MARTDNKIFYDLSLEKYDDPAKKVHWANRSRQLIRFKVMIDLISDTLIESTVVDAGCGLGDLYHYLKEQELEPKKYIGVDTHLNMVALAKERTNQEIIHADILKESLPQADYYLCCGGMNILDRFETLLFIKQMLRFSTKGVIFNILKGEDNKGIYNKYTLEDMKKLLLFFQGEIEVLDHYLEDDFTIFLKKQS
jgi:SAM-dependent methyltransferase